MPTTFLAVRQSLLLAATLLVPLLPALAAPQRMDTLVVSPSENGVARACAADQLCVEIAPSPPGCEAQECTIHVGLQLPGAQRDPSHASYRMEGPLSADASSEL